LVPELIDDDPRQGLGISEPLWTLAIDGRKGLSTLTQFMNARENMYELVYFHKTLRSASVLLRNIFVRAARVRKIGQNIPLLNDTFDKLFSRIPLSIDEYVSLDDGAVWEQIKIFSSNKCEDIVLKKLSSDFLSRRYFKVFMVRPDLFFTLKNLAEEKNNYLSAIISAKKGIPVDDCWSFYGFDEAIFNKVGRTPTQARDSVWILDEGIEGHRFTSLHEHVRKNQGKIEESHYYLAVDDSVVDEINLVVERLSPSYS